MVNYRELIETTLPEGHALAKNDITALHTAIKKAIGEETVPKEDYAVKAQKVTELEGELREMSGEASDGKTYKDLYETEKAEKKRVQGEFDTFKNGIETEKIQAGKKARLHGLLKTAGANPDYVDLLEKEFDLAALEEEGDKFKGWEDILKPIQKKRAGLFGTTVIRGADIGNPPPNSGGAINPWKKGEHFSLEKQTELFRKDPVLARQMAKAAGVTI